MHILPMLIPTRRTGLGAARSDSVALQTTARLTKFRLRSVRNQYFSKNSDTSDM
jgi:hypothetical protein